MIPITQQTFRSLNSFLQTLDGRRFATIQEKLNVITFFKDQFAEWTSEPQDCKRLLNLFQSLPKRNAIYFKTLSVALHYFPIDLELLSLEQKAAYFKTCAEMIENLGFTTYLKPMIEKHLLQIAPHFKQIHLNFDNENTSPEFQNETFLEQLITHSESLEQLWISHSRLSLNALKHLNKCVRLQSLHIDHCFHFNSKLPRGLNRIESIILHHCPNYNQRFPRLPELRIFILKECSSYLHSFPKATTKIQKVIVSLFPHLDDIKYRLKFIKQIHHLDPNKAIIIANSFGLAHTSNAYIENKRKTNKRISENYQLLKKICTQFRPEFFDPILISPSLLTEPDFAKITAKAIYKNNIKISNCNLEQSLLQQIAEHIEELDLRPHFPDLLKEVDPLIIHLLDHHTPKLTRLHILWSQLNRNIIESIIKKHHVELILYFNPIQLFSMQSLHVESNGEEGRHLLENLLTLGDCRQYDTFCDAFSNNHQLEWWLKRPGLFRQDAPYNNATIKWLHDFDTTELKKFLNCPNRSLIEIKVKQTYEKEGIEPFLRSHKLLNLFFNVYNLPLTDYLCFRNKKFVHFCNNLHVLSKSKLIESYCEKFPNDHTTTRWLLTPRLFCLNDPKINENAIRWLMKFEETKIELFQNCPHHAIISMKVRGAYLKNGLNPFILSDALLDLYFTILNFPLSAYLNYTGTNRSDFKKNLYWLSTHKLLETFCEFFPEDENNSKWLLIPDLFVESKEETFEHFDLITQWEKKEIKDFFEIRHPHLLLNAINQFRDQFASTPNFKKLIKHFFQTNPNAKEGNFTLFIKNTPYNLQFQVLPELVNLSPDLFLKALDETKPFYVEFFGSYSIDYGGPGRTFVKRLMHGLSRNKSSYLRFDKNREGKLFPNAKAHMEYFPKLGILFGLCLKLGYPTGDIFSKKWLYCIQSAHTFLSKNNKTYLEWISYLEIASDITIDSTIKQLFFSEQPETAFEAAEKINLVWEEEEISKLIKTKDIESLRQFIFNGWVEEYYPYLNCSILVAQGIRKTLPFPIGELYVEALDELEFLTTEEFSEALQGRLDTEWIKMNIIAPETRLQIIHKWLDDQNGNLEKLTNFVQAFTGASALIKPITFRLSADVDGYFIHTCDRCVDVPISLGKESLLDFLNECGNGTVEQFSAP